MSQSNGVFKAPGWTPTSETDCQLWLSAQGTAYSNGAAVTTLTDLSGKSLVVSAGGTSGGPTFTTNVVNGFPGILFNGTSHFMKVASLVTTRDMCVMVAGKGVSGDGFFIEQSVNINSNNGFAMYGGYGYAMNNSRNGLLAQSSMSSSGTWWGSTAKKWIMNYDATQGSTGSSQTSFNGSTRFNCRTATGSQFGTNATIFDISRQTSGGTPTTQTVTADLYIMSRAGTGVFMNGYIFELAVFNSAKDQNFFQQAENFIWEKWGI